MSFELILPFLQPIEHLIASDSVNEIMVNPNSSIWTEENGEKRLLTGIRFEPGALDAGLEVIANRFGKRLDADSPILNLRLPDGSRLAAVIPPVVHPHPLLTIRKFTARDLKMEDLIARGMLTRRVADNLQQRIHRGDNILISGGTGVGKTSLLNILADAIPDSERILIIEDTAELRVRKPHVVQMEAQLDTHKRMVSFEDLLKATLRHRPDRILVGEVRGSEARTIVDAMNTGHRGMLATIHASSAEDALGRLADLANRSGYGVGQDTLSEIRKRISAIAHVERGDAGKRTVTVTELRT